MTFTAKEAEEIRDQSEDLHKRLGLPYNKNQKVSHGFWALPMLEAILRRIERLEGRGK